ncbi:hypothetical protein SDJN02_23736, partial [Cucurbita argyrosperma subsp. argyrosperma]
MTYYYGGVNGLDSPPVFDQIVDRTVWSVVSTSGDFGRGLRRFCHNLLRCSKCIILRLFALLSFQVDHFWQPFGNNSWNVTNRTVSASSIWNLDPSKLFETEVKNDKLEQLEATLLYTLLMIMLFLQAGGSLSPVKTWSIDPWWKTFSCCAPCSKNSCKRCMSDLSIAGFMMFIVVLDRHLEDNNFSVVRFHCHLELCLA